MASLAFENHPVDNMPHDPGQEDNEGIDNPLNQGQSHHIAVGNMADLMSQYPDVESSQDSAACAGMPPSRRVLFRADGRQATCCAQRVDSLPF